MDFYGYCDLAGSMASALWQPSLALPASLSAIPPRTARSLRGTQVLTSAPIDRRFELYAYARQTGQWGELLGISRSDASRFSLDTAAQKALPPLFIAASKADSDVPFICSQTLAETSPAVETFFVDRLEHDFDRDLTHREGAQAWQACLDVGRPHLEQLLASSRQAESIHSRRHRRPAGSSAH